MSTQPIVIMLVLGLALFVLFVGWGALVVSGQEEEDQQRWIETMAAAGRQEWPAEATANCDYLADETEHDDG